MDASAERPAAMVIGIDVTMAVGDGEAIQHRIWPFPIVEIEASVRLCLGPVAVDNCCCGYVWVIWVGTSHGNGLAAEVKVAITWSGMSALCHYDHVAIIAVVYRRLNSWILTWYQPILRQGPRSADQNRRPNTENRHFPPHFAALQMAFAAPQPPYKNTLTQIS
jgi:hypothetical protein